MTFCFVVAMEAEVSYLLQNCPIIKEERLGFAKVYLLEHKGIRFYAAACGIGKVLSGSGLACIATAHPEIDAFVNLGIGGSLDPKKAPLMSAVIGERFAQHDMDTSSFGTPVGYLNGLDTVFIAADEGLMKLFERACAAQKQPMVRGTVASGDAFITDDKAKAVIVRRFDALLVDMETAAFAEASFVHGKPFTALRVVSDAADHQNEYLKYKFIAGEQACQIGLQALELAQ